MERPVIAEWLGGPEDGAVLELQSGTREVKTAHPQPFDWARDAVDSAEPTQIPVVELVHRVRKFSGKWYIVW